MHYLPSLPGKLRRLELNPMVNGSPAPVSSGRDRRATAAFYFPVGQGSPMVRIVNHSAASRVLVSFAPVEDSGFGDSREPDVHAALEPSLAGQAPSSRVFGGGGALFGHVVVWIDPTGPQPGTASVPVEISY